MGDLQILGDSLENTWNNHCIAGRYIIYIQQRLHSVTPGCIQIYNPRHPPYQTEKTYLWMQIGVMLRRGMIAPIWTYVCNCYLNIPFPINVLDNPSCIVGLGSSVGWTPARANLHMCSQKECPTKFETRWLREIPFSKELTVNYCALRLQLRV